MPQGNPPSHFRLRRLHGTHAFRALRRLLGGALGREDAMS